jgi:hypothetical protein
MRFEKTPAGQEEKPAGETNRKVAGHGWKQNHVPGRWLRMLRSADSLSVSAPRGYLDPKDKPGAHFCSGVETTLAGPAAQEGKSGEGMARQEETSHVMLSAIGHTLAKQQATLAAG